MGVAFRRRCALPPEELRILKEENPNIFHLPHKAAVKHNPCPRHPLPIGGTGGADKGTGGNHFYCSPNRIAEAGSPETLRLLGESKH